MIDQFIRRVERVGRVKPKPIYLALLSLAVLALTFFFAYPSEHPFETWHLSSGNVARDFSAANSTLGFQAILALSQGTKWRVDGLHAAARVSGIEVEIPPQPGWSAPFIKAFQQFGPVEARGAAMAWLGHIDLLKYVIQSGYDSALIMEDDVDWDVNIRKQAPLVSDAVRNLTRQTKEDQAPYGREWDVLWMGHCSDPPNVEQPMIVFDDATVINRDRYRGLNRYITEVLQEGQRSVHHSWNPVCTFAYAVSAKGVRKLLNQASLGVGGAFDLMLMHACQDKIVDCISVNPEIFDAYNAVGDNTSEVRAGDDGEAVHVEDKMGNTDNIRNSARCAGVYHTTCLTNWDVKTNITRH